MSRQRIPPRADRRAAARKAGINWRTLPRVPDLTTRKVKTLKVPAPAAPTQTIDIQYETFTFVVLGGVA